MKKKINKKIMVAIFAIIAAVGSYYGIDINTDAAVDAACANVECVDE